MAISLQQLLQYMVQSKGSDLHVAANSPPMVRVRGDMVKVDPNPLTQQDVEAMCRILMTDAQTELLAKQKSVDFAYRVKGVANFRANVFLQRHGTSFVMRILAENPPTLATLGAPAICERVCNHPNGLVLVCGPTGSGKSTTLAAMINHINMTTNGHILTLEDPVEFLQDSKGCMVNQRALGTHFTDFASALKAGLREDPDVILVGEMRDPETVALALKAAETGHLVFSTLHTNSAAKTVDRIINSFPANEQAQVRAVLSETLRVVISQKLVPTMDGKGRLCMHDILVNTPAAANLIREAKTYQLTTVMQTGASEGMQLLDKALLDALNAGQISPEVAMDAAIDKSVFQKFIKPAPVTAPPPGGLSARTATLIQRSPIPQGPRLRELRRLVLR